MTWWIEPDEVVFSPSGSSVVIASGAKGLSARVSPALPGGRTVSVSDSGLVAIVAPTGAPTVELSGPWTIELFA